MSLIPSEISEAEDDKLLLVGCMVAFMVVSMIPALLWYTFDDFLASRTGIRALGDVSFWHAWAISLFLRFLVSPKIVSMSKQE